MRRGQGLATLLLVTSVILSGVALAAETVRYVNDELIITLRAGQGDEYKILKSLPTGSRLELLEEVPGGEFSRVRTEDGTEGWVRSWYLSKTPTARLLLDDAQRRVERLQNENKSLQASQKELLRERDQLQQQVRELSGSKQSLLQENNKLKDVASRPLELESDNTRLRTESTRLKEENQRLSAENHEFRQSTVQKWFMTGSGVLGFGIILGLVLPRLKSRRSSDW